MIGLIPCVASAVAPVASAEEFFRIQNRAGLYAFEQPNGKPFWSFGVCCTDLGQGPKEYKESNPGFAAHRLYRDDKAFVQDTQSRLRRWQFNSLGGWSDYELFKKHGGEDPMPYFVVLHLGAYDHAPWHDMFAPQFEKAVDDAARKQIEPIAADPNLVGYFSDNELGWWIDTLFQSYFEYPATSPGKQRTVALIDRVYGHRFDRFKRDWKSSATSFDGLLTEKSIKLRPGGNGIRLVNEFASMVGERYYGLMRDTIRRYDKRHLILGDRYQQYYYPAIVESSAKYVDVVSTNYGAEWNSGSISHFFLDSLNSITRKPVIITEFYMCAMENRSGNKNSSGGFPIVQTQTQRATAFSRYINEVAAKPFVIGAHWFQYYDEPAKGRGDGENYNMGLVDTKGVPYEELTQAASHIDFGKLRHGPIVQSARKLMQVPTVPAKPMSGLRDWDRDSSWIPAKSPNPIADLYASADRSNVYVGLLAMDYMDERLYVGDRVPEAERAEFVVTLPWRKKPLRVRFGGKGQKATCDDPTVELAENAGLKHTVIIRVKRPIAWSGKLTATLSTHSRAQTVMWRSDFQIVRQSREHL